MKILITGATGFIGSNIANDLIDQEFELYATYRVDSTFEKCSQFKNKINWINTNNIEWKEQVKRIKPDQLIHVSWGGIRNEDRNNWDFQLRNFYLSKEYFDLAKECEVKKIIALGSQAEYGRYDFPVNERNLPKPENAYGAVKTLCANYLRTICNNSNTDWYWIRVYSVFGERENSNWLIPTVILKLLMNESVSLTACEQYYNFMYIKDFSNQLITIVQSIESKSGIYNICCSKSIKLKNILTEIAKLLNVSLDLLKFGSIPYRPYQNMFISGDNAKFINCFYYNEDSLIGLTNGLVNTINYHKEVKS